MPTDGTNSASLSAFKADISTHLIILPLWGLQISLKGWQDYKNKRNPAEKTPKEGHYP